MFFYKNDFYEYGIVGNWCKKYGYSSTDLDAIRGNYYVYKEVYLENTLYAYIFFTFNCISKDRYSDCISPYFKLIDTKNTSYSQRKLMQKLV